MHIAEKQSDLVRDSIGSRSGQRGNKWGWKETCLGGECTMQCADDVLLNCTRETGMVLLTNVTPPNSVKNVTENLAIFIT